MKGGAHTGGPGWPQRQGRKKDRGDGKGPQRLPGQPEVTLTSEYVPRKSDPAYLRRAMDEFNRAIMTAVEGLPDRVLKDTAWITVSVSSLTGRSQGIRIRTGIAE